MALREDWQVRRWLCPNCGTLIKGIMNNHGSAKVSCEKCNLDMTLKHKNEEFEILELRRAKAQ